MYLRAANGTGEGFVSGTPVHTKDGLVPIEKIQVGDWVLSRHGTTTQIACTRVLNTLAFEDQRVRRIWYSGVRDEMDTVFATDGQLFWVEEIGWTAVDHLDEGHVFELSDGGDTLPCAIEEVWEKTDSPGLGWSGADYINEFGQLIDLRGDKPIVGELDTYFGDDLHGRLRVRVYALEVEDGDSYRVGEIGLWVHDMIAR